MSKKKGEINPLRKMKNYLVKIIKKIQMLMNRVMRKSY